MLSADRRSVINNAGGHEKEPSIIYVALICTCWFPVSRRRPGGVEGGRSPEEEEWERAKDEGRRAVARPPGEAEASEARTTPGALRGPPSSSTDGRELKTGALPAGTGFTRNSFPLQSPLT